MIVAHIIEITRKGMAQDYVGLRRSYTRLYRVM